MWHLSTQLNDIYLDAYITVVDARGGNHRIFIPFLVYDMVYPIIASNIVTLATLSTWPESVRTHT